MADDGMFRKRFGSLEEMAASVRHWDVEFESLAADRSDTELTQIALGPLMLTHLITDCAHAHRGASPPGAKTFALLADMSQNVHWCRQRLDERRLPFFEASQEFEATAHPRFNVYTLTLDAKRLNADPAWQSPLRGRRRVASSQRRLFRADPQGITELRQLISAALELFRDGRLRIAGREACSAAGEEIAGCLLSAVSSAVPAREKVSASARSRALRRALEYLEDSRQDAVRVNQLCQVAQVSERTLQRAFLEHFGVSPKAYVKAGKLRRIRARLLASEPGEALIRDFAIAEGFWHMGQFAQDYWRMFWEPPSHTLNRRPKGRSGHLKRRG